MFAKIEIKGTIESVTGMHIGGSSQFAAIGAVDSPVIRDSYTDQPMIPGSSLKGKMRSLLSRQYNEEGRLIESADDDDIRVLRLFGSAKKSPVDNRIHGSRLIFSDMLLSNGDQLKNEGVSSTEIKFENTINRLTAVANPRQIERAVRGAEYELRLIYNVENKDELEEDFQTLYDGLKLLEYDYIGGHGSRGYGKVRFKDLSANCVIGNVENDLMDRCRKILAGEDLR